MSGVKAITDYGNVAAGEYDFLYLPTVPREGGLGVVACHGSGHPYMFADATHDRAAMLGWAIASAGIPMVAAEFGGQAWGNPEAMDMIDDAITYMGAKAGTSISQVLLIGASMGGYTALRYAKMNPSKVAAVVGMIPLTNMTYFYQNIGGTSDDEIAGAWGVTAPADLPSASQVQEVASSFDMPIRLYYSSTDALIRPSDTTSFAAAVGPNATAINVGTHGHSDQTIGDIFNYGAGHGEDIIDFLIANGA